MFIADKLILQQSFFYADGHDRDLDAWYRIAGLLSFSCYLFLSLRYYAMFRQIALQVLSFADDLSLPWIKHFLLAMLAMQAMDLTFFLLFPDWGSFTSKWWYYLIFSVLFYYVAFTAYTSSSKSLFGFRIISKNDEGINVQVLDVAEVGQLVTEQFAATGLFLSASTSADDVQDSEALLALKQKLQDALEVDRVFEDENLTLSGLAGRLNTNTSALSRVVNKCFRMNFNDLINSHRIAAFQERIKLGHHHTITLLAIASECGFNSKTTFNRVFKRHTGISPKQYIQSLK